jgi:uncharacterized RDD family membrane protein YckC
MVYDAMLVLALWLVTLFPMVALANDAVHGAAVQTLVFLELYAFFVFFWLYRGQTLGMLAWKLEIRTEDGLPLSLGRATLRFFASVLPLIFAAFAYRLFGAAAALACIGVGALGYVWILVDPRNRSWSDLISGTRIVRTQVAPADA